MLWSSRFQKSGTSRAGGMGSSQNARRQMQGQPGCLSLPVCECAIPCSKGLGRDTNKGFASVPNGDRGKAPVGRRYHSSTKALLCCSVPLHHCPHGIKPTLIKTHQQHQKGREGCSSAAISICRYFKADFPLQVLKVKVWDGEEMYHNPCFSASPTRSAGKET